VFHQGEYVISYQSWAQTIWHRLGPRNEVFHIYINVPHHWPRHISIDIENDPIRFRPTYGVQTQLPWSVAHVDGPVESQTDINPHDRTHSAVSILHTGVIQVSQYTPESFTLRFPDHKLALRFVKEEGRYTIDEVPF